MKKIVLIEDNVNVLETTRDILELANYDVFTANNGRDGVTLVKEIIPDLILSDIMMPDLDGYGVLRILSTNPETAGIPFIFLTAKAEKEEMRRGMNLGADDYITKPFEESELLETIEVRLRRSEMLKSKDKVDLVGLNGFINHARGSKTLENLSHNRKIKTYKKKETIFREDDYANYVYFVVLGKVKCTKSDEYGKDLVIDIYEKGDFVGYVTMMEEKEYQETATAMENCELAIIPKDEFWELIRKDRDVAIKFIQMLSGDVVEREKRLLQLAYASVRERVADTLLKLMNNKSQESNQETSQLDISRGDLANIVGTAKESLIRTLSQLKKEGIVETNGQEITILNEAGLQKAATGF